MISARFRLLSAAALIAGVVACDPQSLTASGTAANGQISWLVRGQQIEVTNETPDTLRYAVIGQAYFHTATTSFCFGAPTCGFLLPPTLTGVVSYLDIAGSAKPETHALIIWWKQSTSAVAFDTALVQIR
jgi:hypothetical protein